MYADSISDPPTYTNGMIVKELDETMCPHIPLCTYNWNDLLPKFKEIGNYHIEDAIEPNFWRYERFWLTTTDIVICPTSYDPVADDSEDLCDTESFDQYLLNGTQSLSGEPDSHEEIPTKSRSMHLFPMSYEVRTSFSMASNSENQTGTSSIDECKSIPQQSSLSSSCKIETLQLMSADSEIHKKSSKIH